MVGTMKRAPTLAVLVALAASPAFAHVKPESKSTTVLMPEPGMMAMVSLGLMALGITLRRRRGR